MLLLLTTFICVLGNAQKEEKRKNTIDPVSAKKGVPRNLDECYLPNYITDRIYTMPPDAMAALQEDFQEKVIFNGEEMVRTLKLRYINGRIVGFYRVSPLEKMEINKSERIYFEFGIEWCCTDDSTKEKFCTKDAAEAKSYDSIHPKHGDWEQKVKSQHMMMLDSLSRVPKVKKEFFLCRWLGSKKKSKKQWCCDNDSTGEQFCTQSTLEKKAYDKQHPKHSAWQKLAIDKSDSTHSGKTATKTLGKKKKKPGAKTTISNRSTTVLTDSTGKPIAVPLPIAPTTPTEKGKKKKSAKKTTFVTDAPTTIPTNADTTVVKPTMVIPVIPTPTAPKTEKGKKQKKEAKKTAFITDEPVKTDSVAAKPNVITPATVTNATEYIKKDSVVSAPILPKIEKSKKQKKEAKKTAFITDEPAKTDSIATKQNVITPGTVTNATESIKKDSAVSAPILPKIEKSKKQKKEAKKTAFITDEPAKTDSIAAKPNVITPATVTNATESIKKDSAVSAPILPKNEKVKKNKKEAKKTAFITDEPAKTDSVATKPNVITPTTITNATESIKKDSAVSAPILPKIEKGKKNKKEAKKTAFITDEPAKTDSIATKPNVITPATVTNATESIKKDSVVSAPILPKIEKGKKNKKEAKQVVTTTKDSIPAVLQDSLSTKKP